jgi:anti-sigma28 factor (negative regulator of flagellin synthesis)
MEKKSLKPGGTWARFLFCNPINNGKVRGPAITRRAAITLDWIFEAPIILMDNRKHKGAGKVAAPADKNGKGKAKGKGLSRRQETKDTVLAGNKKLIERVRQIIAETPEIRPEKVGPLLEAVEQGTYDIDVQRLANILLAKLLLEP